MYRVNKLVCALYVASMCDHALNGMNRVPETLAGKTGGEPLVEPDGTAISMC